MILEKDGSLPNLESNIFLSYDFLVSKRQRITNKENSILKADLILIVDPGLSCQLTGISFSLYPCRVRCAANSISKTKRFSMSLF